MPRKNFTRDERKTMIVTVFTIAIQKGEERWLTPYQVARRIGMTNCPTFRHFMSELESEGQLVRREMLKPGRWKGHQFSLAPGTFVEPRKRTIAVRMNGKQAEQLEMF
jgi:hypothetical protein